MWACFLPLSFWCVMPLPYFSHNLLLLLSEPPTSPFVPCSYELTHNIMHMEPWQTEQREQGGPCGIPHLPQPTRGNKRRLTSKWVRVKLRVAPGWCGPFFVPRSPYSVPMLPLNILPSQRAKRVGTRYVEQMQIGGKFHAIVKLGPWGHHGEKEKKRNLNMGTRFSGLRLVWFIVILLSFYSLSFWDFFLEGERKAG